MEALRQSIEALGTEIFGVLARGVRTQLVEISRSGCLLESRHAVEEGTVGELRLRVGRELLVDDVRVTRCVRVEGSGSSYLVGAEFVQTRRPGEASIRRAVLAILRNVTEQARPASLAAKRMKSGRKAEEVSASDRVSEVSTTGEGETVMKQLLARLVREDEGQDLIEYGLLAGLITTAVVLAITTIGTKVLDYFNDLNTALPAAD